MTHPVGVLWDRRYWVAAATGALAACAVAPGCELPEIPVGVCGNRVVEPAAGEACDGAFVDAEGKSYDCGAPDTVGACQFVCDGASEYRCQACCPDGLVCGLDGLCRQPAGAFRPIGVRLGAGAEELVTGDIDGDHRMDAVRLLASELELVFGAARGSAPATRRQVFEPLFLPLVARRSAVERLDVGDDDAGAPSFQPSNLIVSRLGLAVFQAGPDQSPVPVSQAALPAPAQIEELAMMSARVANRVHSRKLLWHAKLEMLGQRWPVLAHLAADEFVVLAQTAGPPSELAAEPVVAQLDERSVSICDDVVLGYKGRSELEFFNPFRLDLSHQADDHIVVNDCGAFLPPVDCPADMPRLLDVGAPLVRGPFAADLNQDGHLDLVVQVENTGAVEDCSPINEPCLETLAAYGVGNGTYHSDPTTLPPFDPDAPDGGQAGDNRFGAAPTVVAEGDPILALTDIDGNGLPDAVTDRRITLSFETPAGTWSRESVAANTGDPWTEAVVAHFNGDGWPDVAATNAASDRVHFFNGAGGGTLNPFNVELEAPLAQLRAGDFDGDSIVDLLGVTSSLDAQGDAVDELTVLFGSPAGRLDPPVVLGRTSHDFRIMAAPFATDLTFVVRNVDDGIDDVVAMASSGGKLHSAHVFAGRSDREICSPLGLVAGFSDNLLEADFRPHLARKVVVGHFVTVDADADAAAPRSEQLAVLAKDALDAADPYRLWIVPEMDERFDPRSVQEIAEPIEEPISPLDEPTTDPVAVWELGLYAAVDLDRDGLDELLAIAPLWADRSRSAYRIATLAADGWQWRPAEGPAVLDLPMFRYSGPTTPCRDPVTYPDTESCEDIDAHRMLSTEFAAPDENGRLRVCRFEADADAPDALVLISLRAPCTEEEVAQATCPAIADREPRLLVYRFDGALELTRDRFVEIPLPGGARLFDVDCLDADGRPGQELVVLTSEGARIVYGPASAEPSVSAPIVGTSGYLRVAAGDVDGEGIDDLVLANRSETVLFHAIDPMATATGAP